MASDRETIWNVKVHTASLEEILDAIDERISSGITGTTLFCANPHSLVVARIDPDFLAALSSSEFLIPDGTGIVAASRFLGGNISARITGFDLFTGLAKRWNGKGGRSFFFLGSSEEVLNKIKTRMSREYPGITISGTYSPPFSERLTNNESDRIIEAVNDARPTALWVGMTAPKQEKWIHDHRGRLNVPFTAAIGAAFDYFAGTRERASASMQSVGLEWLPRLIREPRRMWKRNFVSTPVFLYYIIRQKIGLSRNMDSHYSTRT